LTDFSQAGLYELLSDYRQREGLSDAEPVNCALAFDATSVSSTGVLQNESRGHGCFAFIILSLDHRLSDLLIRSISDVTGRMDSQVLRIKSDLFHVLTETGFVCRFVATDSDNVVNQIHSKAFQQEKNQDGSMEHIWTYLLSQEEFQFVEWPVSDLLHLLKNDRSRIASNTLVFSGRVGCEISGRLITAQFEDTIMCQSFSPVAIRAKRQ
jgi:hypothetical protein